MNYNGRDVRIDETSLATYKCLKRGYTPQLETLGDILQLSNKELLEIRGVGKETLYDIGDCLRQYGFSEYDNGEPVPERGTLLFSENHDTHYAKLGSREYYVYPSNLLLDVEIIHAGEIIMAKLVPNCLCNISLTKDQINGMEYALDHVKANNPDILRMFYRDNQSFEYIRNECHYTVLDMHNAKADALAEFLYGGGYYLTRNGYSIRKLFAKACCNGDEEFLKSARLNNFPMRYVIRHALEEHHIHSVYGLLRCREQGYKELRLSNASCAELNGILSMIGADRFHDKAGARAGPIRKSSA